MIGLALMPAVVRLADEIRRLDRARLPYIPFIRSAADTAGLSYYLLSSLLWVESQFNPDARGGSGELGMAQMKSAAAGDVGTSLSAIENNPELQIRKGAEYLRLMIDRAGDVVSGLRAYNAGLKHAKLDPSASMEYAGRILGLAVADMLIGQMA